MNQQMVNVASTAEEELKGYDLYPERKQAVKRTLVESAIYGRPPAIERLKYVVT